MIAIIDYGVGNLFSLKSSLSMINAEAVVSGDADVIRAADRIILPGVGTFGDARRKLADSGLDSVLMSEAAKGKPVMGSCLRYQAQIPSQKIGTFDTELVEEFFLAVTRAAGMTLHIRQMDGTNSHHIVEAMFKAFGRALREAVSYDESARDEIPSTKGVLV